MSTTEKATKTTKPKAVKPVKKAVVTEELEATPVVEITKTEPAKKEKPVESSLYLEKGKYVAATGRRKTATATVRLFTGKGENMVGQKTVKAYFDFPLHLSKVMSPFDLTGLSSSTYFTASIRGGGKKAHAEGLALAIAKAIATHDPEFRLVLKKNGLLTRDDRRKERKKPGLKGARRRPQWAKR